MLTNLTGLPNGGSLFKSFTAASSDDDHLRAGYQHLRGKGRIFGSGIQAYGFAGSADTVFSTDFATDTANGAAGEDGIPGQKGDPGDLPFSITRTGKVNPGLVGLIMPTLGGEPLATTSNVLILTAETVVYFKMNFTVNYESSYLSGWTLDSVSIEQDISVPPSTDSTKYLAFNIISGGEATTSYFTSSLNVRLVDNGPSSTRLEYNPF